VLTTSASARDRVRSVLNTATPSLPLPRPERETERIPFQSAQQHTQLSAYPWYVFLIISRPLLANDTPFTDNPLALKHVETAAMLWPPPLSCLALAPFLLAFYRRR
jgi:hypothetical protein